jgi:hypothetical protein
MPIIKIISKNVFPYSECFHLAAKILYPHNPEMEKLHFINGLWPAERDHECGVITKDQIEAFMNYGRKSFQEDVVEATARAGVVGQILVYLARLAFHHPDCASKNKAEWLTYSQLCASTRHNLAQEAIYVSSGKIDQYWKEFKDVAHFWAAEQVLTNGMQSRADTYLFSPPHIQDLLDVANWFYGFGTEFRSVKRGNNRMEDTVLNSETAFTTPFKTKTITSMKSFLLPLDEEELSILKKYTAKGW